MRRLDSHQQQLETDKHDAALSTYEPAINSKVDQFIEQLSKRGTIDATAWSMYLSFDIMGK